MRKPFLVAGLFLLSALPALAAAAAPRGLGIPPLAWRERVLPNGMQILSIEDHASPTVAVQVWYHVGSKDDPAKRSGFAHLFEHLMFKSTKNLAAEQFDRLTEDVGGANNASTGDDVTNYFEVVPSNYLRTLLWAEAERLSNLRVDEPNFKSERAVVEEEYRQSVLAPPYGRFQYALQSNSYAVHPYQRPTIGSIEDLDAAALDDVVAFHRTYYRPDNATLIVVGDFEPAQFDTWVDQYFAALKKPAEAIPRVTAVEPERTTNRRLVVRAPNVPLPAVGLTWLGPPAKSADAPALRVAAALLAGGESSRFHQSLVYRQRLAQDTGFDFTDTADRGLLIATAVLASGKKTADAEAALLAEIDRAQKKPISPAELDKAKTQLLTKALESRETNQGKGFALGNAVILNGDATRVNRDLDALQAVTAADVQRVLKRYVTSRPRVVVEYLPQSAKAASGEAK